MTKAKLILFLLLFVSLGLVVWKMLEQPQKTQFRVETETASGAQEVSSGVVNTINKSETAFVAEAEGDVIKNGATQTRGRRAQAGVTFLAAGDSLTTLTGASATLIFADNTVVRLSEKSKITLNRINETGAAAQLLSGSLWARVLRPLGDSGTYEFKTNDISAGVRGTSVYLGVTASGTVAEVHDSFAEKEEDKGVIIQSLKGRKKFRLAPRERVIVSVQAPKPQAVVATGSEKIPEPVVQIQKETFDKTAMLEKDPFKRENTAKDIVYMSRVLSEKIITQNAEKKIEGELESTLPKTEKELRVVLAEKELLPSAAPARASAPLSRPSEPQVMEKQNIVSLLQRDLAVQELRKIQKMEDAPQGDLPVVTPSEGASHRQVIEKEIKDLIQAPVIMVPEKQGENIENSHQKDVSDSSKNESQIPLPNVKIEKRFDSHTAPLFGEQPKKLYDFLPDPKKEHDLGEEKKDVLRPSTESGVVTPGDRPILEKEQNKKEEQKKLPEVNILPNSPGAKPAILVHTGVNTLYPTKNSITPKPIIGPVPTPIAPMIKPVPTPIAPIKIIPPVSSPNPLSSEVRLISSEVFPR